MRGAIRTRAGAAGAACEGRVCGGEAIDVLVRKRRYACLESVCARKTFTERTDQLPARTRLTTRLAQQVITACRAEPRAISRVADEAGLAWPTVMRLLTATVDAHGGQVDTRHGRRLGIDEHRFRRVRYTRDEHGTVTRGYASTAHRAQGRTVESAHAYVSVATVREPLYVMATRERESNRLYVDTMYDPDAATSHDEPIAAQAIEVLQAAVATRGADLSATERRRLEVESVTVPWRLQAEGAAALDSKQRLAAGGQGIRASLEPW